MGWRLCLWPLAFLFFLFPATAFSQPADRAPNSSRDCAICHLEWTESFGKPGRILLIDKPDKGVQADEETCLGCHDGAVASDARVVVWRGHGHKTNIAPPAGMKIPDNFPLDNGKLACRTCHTAHASPGKPDLTQIIFLRVRNDASQLCQSCHGDKSGGPGHGTHPLGPMASFAMPPELTAAGGKSAPDGKSVTCQSCHRSHGSQEDHLLVMGASSSQLCMSCHNRLRPEMWQTDVALKHPINPPLQNDAQRQAIKDMGTRVGPNDTLVCFSCHKLHDGQAGRYLLAETLADSKLCLRCHEDRKVVFGSQHDLRRAAPKEENRHGQTAEQSGPCGACHSFHTYARPLQTAAADPQGQCLTCHAQGKVAGKDLASGGHGGTSFGHPVAVASRDIPLDSPLHVFAGKERQEKDKTISCLTCHDPHTTGKAQFLRLARADLCGACHVKQSQSLAGDHDFTTHADLKNAQGKTAVETGKCGFCHDVHHANGPALWTATSGIPQTPDGLCLECHRPGGLAAKVPAFAFSHPTGPRTSATTHPSAALPLFDPNAHRSADKDAFVTCASCHDPHTSKKASRSLLRVTSTTSALCLQCHPQQAALVRGPHDESAAAKPWPTHEKVAAQDACMACHRAHSNDSQRQLWAVAPSAGANGADGVCIACHPTRRWAPPQAGMPVAADNLSAIRLMPNGGLPQDLGDMTVAGTGPIPLQPGNIVHPSTLPAGGQPAALARLLPLNTVVPTQAGTSPATMPLAAPALAIGCKTCHNPHASPSAPSLLRVEVGKGPQDLCYTCHKDTTVLEQSMHRREMHQIDQAAPKSVCGPCHAVHAVEGSMRPGLWAVKLGNQGANDEENHCFGCHFATGPGKPVPAFRHPLAAFKSLKFAATPPAGLEKVSVDDVRHARLEQLGVTGLTCSTCHTPHGVAVAGLGQALAGQGAAAGAYLAAARPMLRPAIATDLCANCHGPDATRVFLYYHQPAKRQNLKKVMEP